MIQVKICGITNLEDALLCAELGFNAIGFIFYEKSKRNVGVDIARKIVDELPPFIMKIGVFVEKTEDDINQIARFVGLNAVQLHNQTRVWECDKLLYQKIVAVSGDNIKSIDVSKKVIYLVDSSIQGNFGGTGVTFDWSVIPMNLRDKIILAGGIDANNILKALELGYRNFDLSSSVEQMAGKKSKEKLVELKKTLNKYRGNYAEN
ncbi:MAG TPA: phosphoribosylanthranilate isomerase [Ignavibacteriales bacterium]|nr:phosphoribosylanthranilate isomerase [Ignavibacteriales bacterium]HOM65868.1 phosphoribosylanthranilate isomerase [Ignavibacteriales bacterium]HPD67624.1 phosphoribosylanthranilate isomerase [Ignavibacteriales bacterium]HPP33277.1 phosphoribosylanthranilate isomerase [Ignavibacteriales bacterium]HRR17953.1 phosphoribosylanthranilate isomerase [Ignavibacteriales bacterium]